MDVIGRKIVENIWIKAGQNTVEQLFSRKQNFQQNQPLLFQFLSKFTDHINAEATEITFFYSSIIWEIFQSSYKKALPEIPESLLYSIIDEREKWFEKITDFDYEQIDKLINNDATINQINILSYALEVLLEEGEDNLELNKEDQAYLFWLFVIVVDALDKISS